MRALSRSFRSLAVLSLAAPLLLGVERCVPEPELRFTDVTLEAGLDFAHGYAEVELSDQARIAGGVAAGDYDGDGWIDLFAVGGTAGPDRLFRNRGDGSFEEVAAEAGVALEGRYGSGPVFADVDGDGWLDLLVNGVLGSRPRLFFGAADGRFEEGTAGSGLDVSGPTFSAAFGDVDRDGDLDLFLTHWGSPVPSGSSEHLWRNDGSGRFEDVSVESGVAAVFPVESPFFEPDVLDLGFTPNFADLDGDRWPDLLIAADFGTSRVLRNTGGGRFEDVTTSEISDENGMGAAVGDFDGDLDLDWFVSSIDDADIPPGANWGGSGNRLYRNDGGGVLRDATTAAGVRAGYWGWGACAADFDNDGHLDLFHVNGWRGDVRFVADPSRLFLSNGDGSFRERSAALGLVDDGQGRGVVCFDYDRDGDVDVLVANNQQPVRLYRNDGGNALHSVGVRLVGPPGNTRGIGAWVLVTALAAGPSEGGGPPRLAWRTQLREIRAGSHFVSQDPAEAHFGLGGSGWLRRIEVRWPDGRVSTRRWLPADRVYAIAHPEFARRPVRRWR